MNKEPTREQKALDWEYDVRLKCYFAPGFRIKRQKGKLKYLLGKRMYYGLSQDDRYRTVALADRDWETLERNNTKTDIEFPI